MRHEASPPGVDRTGPPRRVRVLVVGLWLVFAAGVVLAYVLRAPGRHWVTAGAAAGLGIFLFVFLPTRGRIRDEQRRLGGRTVVLGVVPREVAPFVAEGSWVPRHAAGQAVLRVAILSFDSHKMVFPPVPGVRGTVTACLRDDVELTAESDTSAPRRVRLSIGDCSRSFPVSRSINDRSRWNRSDSA